MYLCTVYTYCIILHTVLCVNYMYVIYIHVDDSYVCFATNVPFLWARGACGVLSYVPKGSYPNVTQQCRCDLLSSPGNLASSLTSSRV